MIFCQVLDAIGQQYGKLPHELLALSPAELALAYSVMKRKGSLDGD